jgi:lysophospholipase L1-like esterase
LRDHVLPNLAREEYDYISLNIGVNDAKNFHTGKRFCKEFGTLLYAILARFPHAQIIWGGIIDMEQVPTLTTPLNKILSIRSRILDRNGRILCEERGAHAPKSNWKVIPENFARDGFHASSLGYQRWADELADYILSIEDTRVEETPK